MLVLGDAHAADPEKRAALYAAYEAAADDAAAAVPSDASAADRPGADPVLQLGDLEHYDLPRQTYFVGGNNEDFDVIEAMRHGERPEDVRNAHLIASTIVEVGGLRVAGLSGNFAPTRYDYAREELQQERRRHFVRDDVERLAAVEDVDVLMVHEAPHGLLYYNYDPGCEHVDRLLRELDPDLCLVGHHETHVEGQLQGVRVVAVAPAWERYYLLDPDTLSLESRPTPAPESSDGSGA